MICDTCERKPNCLPVALAAKDARLHDLLTDLKGCDRHQTVREATAPPGLLCRQLRQLFTRHPA